MKKPKHVVNARLRLKKVLHEFSFLNRFAFSVENFFEYALKICLLIFFCSFPRGLKTTKDSFFSLFRIKLSCERQLNRMKKKLYKRTIKLLEIIFIFLSYYSKKKFFLFSFCFCYQIKKTVAAKAFRKLNQKMFSKKSFFWVFKIFSSALRVLWIVAVKLFCTAFWCCLEDILDLNSYNSQITVKLCCFSHSRPVKYFASNLIPPFSLEGKILKFHQ